MNHQPYTMSGIIEAGMLAVVIFGVLGGVWNRIALY